MNQSTISIEKERAKGRPRTALWVGPALLVVVVIIAGAYFYIRANETRNLDEARTAISKSDWKTASSSLEKTLATQPAFMRQHVNEAIALRGFVAFQMGDLSTALADLDQALAEDLELIDLLAYRADIQFRKDNHELALKDGELALEQSELLPDHLMARLHANQAVIYYQNSKDQDVVSEVEAAVDLSQHLEDEILAELYALRSSSAYRLEDFVTSQEDTRSALSFDVILADDLLAMIYANQAEYLFEREQYDQFMDASDHALQYASILSDETLTNLHLQKSQILYDQGELVAAISEAEQAASYGEDLVYPHALQALHSYLLFDEKEAMVEAEAALALDDQSVLAHRIRGSLLAAQGDARGALEHLEKALALEADDLDALTMSVQVHLGLNNAEAAEAAMSRAVELDPNSAATLWARAMVHEQNHELEAAGNLIDQAIALDSNRPEFFTVRSRTYRLTKENDDVKTDLERALAINPGHLVAEAGLVVNRAAEFDYENYETNIQELINKYPKWYKGHAMLAEYYLWVTGDLERATIHAEKVVELRPEFGRGHVLQGNVYLQQNDYEQAEAAFEQAVEVDSQSTYTLGGLVDYYLATKEFDKALAVTEDMRTLSPEEIYPRVAQARVYLMMGDLQSAWIEINKVLADDPQNPTASLIRASINQQLGDYQEAMIDLSRVTDNFPLYADALLQRAAVYSIQGEVDLAKQYANQTLEVDPTRGNAHGLLSDIAGYENDLEESLAQANFMIEKSPDLVYGYLTQGLANASLERFDEAIASYSAGLEVESVDDETIGLLTYQRALANHILGNKEQGMADFQSVLETTLNVELLNETENFLAYPSLIPIIAGGRVLIEDEVQRFGISYSTNWERLESEPESGYVLSLWMEEGDAFGSVDVFLLEWDLDASTLANVVPEALYDAGSFNSLALDSKEVAGENGFVRHYERNFEDGTVVEGRHYYAVQDGRAAIIVAETTPGDLDRFAKEFDEIATSFTFLP